MIEQSNDRGSIDAQPTANGDAAAAHDATSPQKPSESSPAPQAARKATRTRTLLFGVAFVVLLMKRSVAEKGARIGGE